MTVYFLDSSALVKRYINEKGSAWILGLFDPAFDHEFFITAVTSVEIVAAITRRSRGGSINPTDATVVRQQFRNDIQTEYQVIEVTEQIITSGMMLAETYALRGYDAIQLASCCAVNELCIANGLSPIVLVSADEELNLGAANENILIENPNN